MLIFEDYEWKTDDKKDPHFHIAQMYANDLLEKTSNLYSIKMPVGNRNTSDLMKYAIMTGMSAVCEHKGALWIGRAHYSDGTLLPDGTRTQVIVTFRDGTTETKTVGKDVALFWLNNLRMPIIHKIGWFADMLAHTDVSLKYNLLYSRVCPIPIVENETDKKSIEEILKNLFKGSLAIFKRTANPNKFNNIKNDTVMNITNPSTSTFIQNLSRLHDELIVRYSLEMGVYVSSRDKGAQLTDKELSAFSDYCTISADDTIEQLKKFAEEMKSIFNVECEVEPKSFVYTQEDIEKEQEASYGENIDKTERSEGDEGTGN